MALPALREIVQPDEAPETLPLENGDRLDQPTYHARYETMPEHVRAELIGGIVFMASPAKMRHMRGCGLAYRWLAAYEEATPGTEALSDGTVILGPQSEPEPDVFLRILPQYGGRTRDIDDYVTGAPELVVEVASSSAAIDLHLKKADYEKAGVDEYVVALVRTREVRWFFLEGGHYRPLEPDADGIFRSRKFPGLWLDPQALLGNDIPRLREVLGQGLASEEHAAWVEALDAAGPE
jgi:Uma2 family endonuclease